MSYDKEDVRLESKPIKPDRMKISVTQEDIDTGITEDCRCCPIANAICRTVGPKGNVLVDSEQMIEIGFSKYRAVRQEIVAEFIASFDDGEIVHPFEFEIEEIIE
jgi:hypothetical protein